MKTSTLVLVDLMFLSVAALVCMQLPSAGWWRAYSPLAQYSITFAVLFVGIHAWALGEIWRER